MSLAPSFSGTRKPEERIWSAAASSVLRDAALTRMNRKAVPRFARGAVLVTALQNASCSVGGVYAAGQADACPTLALLLLLLDNPHLDGAGQFGMQLHVNVERTGLFDRLGEYDLKTCRR